MSARRFRLAGLGLTVILLVGGSASAIGFILGETKEELKLKYDVAVQDHGTGRVTVVLTLADEGRLAPLDEVELVIPAEKMESDGGRWMDLAVSIEMRKSEDGQRVGRVHFLKTLAERASIRLNTHTMDGNLDPLTRLHHVIELDKYLKDAVSTTKASKPAPEAAPAAPPASERRK
jgi:hypothetical protein